MRNTNEELALRIQKGDSEAIPELWEQVVKFIEVKAQDYIVRKQQSGLSCDGEKADLVNQAYFGFLTAVRLFDPDAGSFLTILNLAIKTSFSEASGYRKSAQRWDCSHNSVSGDTPAGEEGHCLFDFVPDKGENVEDLATKDIYTLQLRNTLDCAMKDLPRRQEMILRARYYEDLQQEAIARRLNCTSSNVSQQEQAALDALYQARFQNGLHEYLEQNTNYSRHVGVRRFRSTGTSAVEEIVFQRERLIGKWMKAHYRKSIGGEADADDTEGAAAPVYEENRVV